MYLVGLTGGIASGKSTVAARLVHHGAELIDADLIAREVVLPGTPTWKRIVDHFGEDVIDEDGFIDRPALARIVFGDPAKRRLLNELTHPAIARKIADNLELLTAYEGLVVLDIALLVEMGLDHGYEAIIVVSASPEIQLRRLVELRAMDPEQARARMASQAALADKLAVATHVIENNGSMSDLLARVDEVAAELKALAREKESLHGEVPND